MSELRDFDSRPWLILCEGESDKRLLHQLISVRGIADDFQIRFPARKGKSGGRGNFGPWLDVATGATGWPNIRGLLILSDRDDDESSSFKK